METVVDTPLAHGVIFWPIRPPRTSMLVVVKATFALDDGGCVLSDAQDPTTGQLHWDDDPTRSARYPSDFALLKPRGECFVVGSCRTLTERPVDQTEASFRVGSVGRRIRVYGDRTWVGGAPSRPVPFAAMPLAWERAFGGPGFGPNPVGRGVGEDASGVAWLPNLEDADRPVTGRSDRPAPVGVGPIGMTWPARAQHLGTYDARWQATRAPWLAEDFRFAFFNEAPPEQQIASYWRGDEPIELKHLHPRQPHVRARLPGVLARAFVERGAAFDEIPLVLDTVTVDADRGLVLAVWRGTVELAHDRLTPDGIDRLFVMHEALGAPSPLAACRVRMLAKIAADAQAHAEMMTPAEPPVDDVNATLVEAPVADLAEASAAVERLREAEAPREDVGAAALEKLKVDLANAGVDVERLLAEAEGRELAMPEPVAKEQLLKAIAEAEVEVPPELLEGLLDPTPDEDDAYEREAPAPPVDLREQIVALHRRKQPVRGDFSGANLGGLDLRGLDARDAILMDANLRGANLAGAKLDGATLLRADLLSADLTKATLRKADLTEAVLEDAKLTGAVLAHATLERAELQEAVLDEASLEKADLTGAQLDRASLVGAKCDEAIFNQAHLEGAVFKRASLVSARFFAARGEVDFDGAELTGVRVGRGADLSRSRVRGAKASDSHWRDSTLEGVVFTGSAMNGADFSRSALGGAQLEACWLRRARFLESRLEGASFRGSDLYEAMFREADLAGASFRDANLYRADFYRAHGEGVTVTDANLDGTTWSER